MSHSRGLVNRIIMNGKWPDSYAPPVPHGHPHIDLCPILPPVVLLGLVQLELLALLCGSTFIYRVLDMTSTSCNRYSYQVIPSCVIYWDWNSGSTIIVNPGCVCFLSDLYCTPTFINVG
jgi:hypothetical protein